MWIIQLKHPKTGQPYLMEWSLEKKGPAAGAALLLPGEFEQYVRTSRTEHAQALPNMLANGQHHGTSHGNRIVTPERWLAQSYRKPEGQAGGPYTVEELFEKYGPKEAKAAAKKPRKK